MKYIIANVFLLFSFVTNAQRPLVEAEVQWLSANVVSFHSPIDQVQFEEFDRLSIPEKTRIVSLGEANHGTREFQLLKHKLADYLTKKHDFNTLVFEFPYSDGLILNEYVLGLNDHGLKILTGRMNSEYHNTAFIEFIESIRRLNADKVVEDKIQFLGGDIFGKPSALMQLIEYAKSHNRALFERIVAYRSLTKDLYMSAFKQDSKVFKRLSGIILTSLKKNKKEYLSKSTEIEYNRMVRLAQILGIAWKGNKRAREWAVNVLHILAENPQNKLFIFGHNIHVGTFYKKEVGSYLKKEYPGYFAIGTDYNTGSFIAKNMKDRKNPYPDIVEVLPMENSTAHHISSNPGEFHFLRMPAENSESTKWLFEPNFIARVGFGFTQPFTKPEQGRSRFNVAKSLNALIVFDSIIPIQLLNETPAEGG